MKKLFSAFLAVCMVSATLTVGASAAYMDDANHVTDDIAGNNNTAGIVANGENGDEIGSVDIPVYIETESEHSTINVYALSYDVSELTFKYSKSSSDIWNPETLEYENYSSSGSWNTTSQDITVKNYSDIAVKVSPSQTAADPAIGGVTVSLGEALELASAYDGVSSVPGTVKSGVISVSVDGAPTGNYPAKTLMTTVTLTVTDNR